MNTLQHHINEALFGKEEFSPGKTVDRMFSLTKPKDEVDYLNYLCAWYRILATMFYAPTTCYWFLGQYANKETYVEYGKTLLELYRLNLPDFHIETTDKEYKDINYEAYNIESITMTGYEEKWDDMIVKKGKMDDSLIKAWQDKMDEVPENRSLSGEVVRSIVTDTSDGDKAHLYYFLINGRANDVTRGKKYFHSKDGKSNPSIKYKRDMQKWADEIMDRFSKIVGRKDLVFRFK